MFPGPEIIGSVNLKCRRRKSPFDLMPFFGFSCFYFGAFFPPDISNITLVLKNQEGKMRAEKNEKNQLITSFPCVIGLT